jgi:four helix bundle protein
MTMKTKKIQYFYDLDTWKEAHRLVLSIYELVDRLPPREKFVLSSQMLRAAISITSNIAEGFGRKHLKEKIQYYSMARASLTEPQNQLIICKDVNYVDNKGFSEVWKQSVVVHKMLNALISSLKRKT